MKTHEKIAETIHEELKGSYDSSAIAENPLFNFHTDFIDEAPEDSALVVEHHEDGNSVNVYATTLNFNEVLKVSELLIGYPVKEVPFIAAQVTPAGVPYLHLLIEIR